MGGADAIHGDLVRVEDVRDAWVVDLAGDLPLAQREAAALWLPRVFADLEDTPANLARLRELAATIAGALRGERTLLAPTAPARVYVLCGHGLNRSGLVTGLLLRALGLDAAEAAAAIATRPGALNNRTYARLVAE